MDSSRARLVAILQLAYSGELAAGYAYRGHARAVSDSDQRERIRKIEDEEWHHRRRRRNAREPRLEASSPS